MSSGVSQTSSNTPEDKAIETLIRKVFQSKLSELESRMSEPSGPPGESDQTPLPAISFSRTSTFGDLPSSMQSVDLRGGLNAEPTPEVPALDPELAKHPLINVDAVKAYYAQCKGIVYENWEGYYKDRGGALQPPMSGDQKEATAVEEADRRLKTYCFTKVKLEEIGKLVEQVASNKLFADGQARLDWFHSRMPLICQAIGTTWDQQYYHGCLCGYIHLV